MWGTRKVLFSAFDAGGGNAILPVVKNLLADKKCKLLCLIGGPSKEIFKKEKIKFIDADLLNDKDLHSVVNNFKPDFFISGTSLGPRFDKKILFTVRGLGAKSIYILDYWAHYWERFSGDKKDFVYLPDLICIMDENAKKEMIAEGFNSKMIKVTGNPHFDYFQKNIKKGIEDKLTVLFISQPLKKSEFGYDEFGVLNDLLEVLDDLMADFKVIIRLHPKEDSGKFDKYLNKSRNIKIESKFPIEKNISRAGLVIGMNSMVLFQAAIAGKKVISYQPNLKTKDFLISNKFGLSKLVTKKADLKKILKIYFNGNFIVLKKQAQDLIIPNATKNIINLIKNL
ncbi:hypothetical protein KJ671_03535 [Patescibacteria group bacterium]|nr:hypothetical protein [Patescibacteria group bacterium]